MAGRPREGSVWQGAVSSVRYGGSTGRGWEGGAAHFPLPSSLQWCGDMSLLLHVVLALLVTQCHGVGRREHVLGAVAQVAAIEPPVPIDPNCGREKFEDHTPPCTDGAFNGKVDARREGQGEGGIKGLLTTLLGHEESPMAPFKKLRRAIAH